MLKGVIFAMILPMKTKTLAKKTARRRSVASPPVRVIKSTAHPRVKILAGPAPDDFLAQLELLQRPFRAHGELVAASREESDLLARMIAGEAA
ncbi:MAG: hypothetical protein IPK32_00565 [Verrucomicrobiaceae bacterium]|nr:hypothetical protein [Verrucomicrobiaceae bacterium]